MIFLLQAGIETAVCTVVSGKTRSPCEKCALGETDWHRPLQIEWYLDFTRRLGDLTSLDRSEVSRSILVSDRLRGVLERDCTGIQFFPVMEVNAGETEAEPGLRPFWQAVPPVLVIDTAARAWVADRGCPACGKHRYIPGGGGYFVDPEEVAGRGIFQVKQLGPGTFVTESLKGTLEALPFTNIDIPMFPAIVQIGAAPQPKEAPSTAPRPSIPGAPHLHELPKDPAEWTSEVQVAFSRLSPDTAESCPEPPSEIMNYVRMESADYDQAEEKRLDFLRTAQVGDEQYWLWKYTESDGQKDYVFFRKSSTRPMLLGLTGASPVYGSNATLSAEQYLLALYYDLVYWP